MKYLYKIPILSQKVYSQHMMPYTVALTGTIASGKSTAAAFFKQQHIDVISADEIARDLTQPHTVAFETIVKHFGQNILLTDGTLDRHALRQKIIRHPDDRQWLEAYLHPQIRATIKAKLDKTQSPYVVIEIPLLTRREDFPYLNHVLLVEINETLQLERLIARDKCTKEEALELIQIQPLQTIRRALADDVIYNDGNPKHFELTLRALHERFLRACSKSPILAKKR